MKKKNMISLLIMACFIGSLFPSLEVLGDKTEIEEQVQSIEKEEKEILELLFSQLQEIDQLERENIKLNLKIEDLHEDIKSLEKMILTLEVGYDQNLVALETLLKSYQRMGAGSYLEIILESESMPDLLKRINILRDLSKNSKNLLETIEKDKDKLGAEKEKLDSKLNDLLAIQESLKENISKKHQVVKENEDYLQSLAEDRGLYEERLNKITLLMGELKTIIGEFTQEFTKVIESGNFPPDAISQTLTLKGISATLKERTFNQIIQDQENLPPIEFKFKEDLIEMNIPDKQLYLSGNFTIENDRVLAFQPERGTFFGMTLEKGTMEDLFEEGAFLLDLEPLIDKMIIKSITLKDGSLEMLVTIELFKLGE